MDGGDGGGVGQGEGEEGRSRSGARVADDSSVSSKSPQEWVCGLWWVKGLALESPWRPRKVCVWQNTITRLLQTAALRRFNAASDTAEARGLSPGRLEGGSSSSRVPTALDERARDGRGRLDSSSCQSLAAGTRCRKNVRKGCADGASGMMQSGLAACSDRLLLKRSHRSHSHVPLKKPPRPGPILFVLLPGNKAARHMGCCYG